MLISTFFTLPVEQIVERARHRRRKAAGRGRPSWRSPAASPGRRSRSPASSRGNSGTRRSAATKATMYRLPNSTTSKVIAKCSVGEPARRRVGQRRHRGEIFGRAHRHVEHHADQQRHHHPACAVKRMPPGLARPTLRQRPKRARRVAAAAGGRRRNQRSASRVEANGARTRKK